MTELAWARPSGLHRLVEPTPAAIAEHAATLARWYDENAAMLGNTTVMSAADVREYWAEIEGRRARGFLLFVDDSLVGDGEIRNVSGGAGEFAILIGEGQGRALGTTFGVLLHVFAFRELGLARVYSQHRPENVRIARVERRLGYVPDDSSAARAFADVETDVTTSLAREVFAATHADAWREVTVRA